MEINISDLPHKHCKECGEVMRSEDWSADETFDTNTNEWKLNPTGKPKGVCYDCWRTKEQ